MTWSAKGPESQRTVMDGRSRNISTSNGAAVELRNGSLYRRYSNLSDASFINDVDMAQDEMFSGPISESVPTSNTGFAHRGTRADSITSFTYYEEDLDTDSWLQEEAIIDEEEETIIDEEEDEYREDEEDDGHEQNGFARPNIDVEYGERPLPARQRKSSGLSRTSRTSRTSTQDPLLRRHDSSASDISNASGQGTDNRQCQKIYIQSEDLTIVIAGFRTSVFGLAVYTTICIVTAGLGYLLFRWLPRWRILLVGSATALKNCSWVIIEVRPLMRYS